MFMYFSALPPELRRQIWDEALSGWTVWVAARDRSRGHHDLGGRSLVLSCVGSPPYLVGLSSREARQVLEEMYIKPIRGLAAGAGVYWVHLSTTVVHLGNCSDAISVLESLDADELSRIEHISLQWYQFFSVARACQHLARTCPALRTIIIQLCESKDAESCQPISPDVAAYYTAISRREICPDARYFRALSFSKSFSYFQALLLQYFGDSPPRVHLLPPRPTLP